MQHTQINKNKNSSYDILTRHCIQNIKQLKTFIYDYKDNYLTNINMCNKFNLNNAIFNNKEHFKYK